MLSSSLVALAAFAVFVSAVPSLTLKTSTPNTDVDGLENLKVTAIITNTGDETLRLLNDPRGVLSTFPENTFTITDPAGSRPSFNGAKVKYSPAYAAGLDNPSVFTVLNPGTFISVTHDLSAAYNFTRSGAGAYSIEPSNLFIYVDADGTPKNLYATVEDIAEVKLSGNLAISRIHNKRAAFESCPWVYSVLLQDAIDSAQIYANNAYSYITGISSGTPRYETWFGTYTASRKSTVQDHFQLISSHGFSSFTYRCDCSADDIFAYVYANEFGIINICEGFYNSPLTGTDSRAGTLVHESSHFTLNGATLDYAYSQARVKDLAINNPSWAIQNAESHEYFAENNPSLS